MMNRSSLVDRKSSNIVFAAIAIVVGIAIGFSFVVVRDKLVISGGLIALFLLSMIVFKPEWGVLLLVFISYTRFSDNLIDFYGFPSIARAYIGFLVVVIAIRWISFKEVPKGWEKAIWPILAYGVVSFASALFKGNFALAQTALLDYIKDVIIAIIIIVLLKDAETFKRTIWVLLLVGIFLGGISVFQYVTDDFTNPFGGFGQTDFKNIVAKEKDFRVSGPVGDPNYYAQIMIVLIPLGFERFWNDKNKFRKGVALLSLILSLSAVILTFSRGGFVALVIMGILLIIYFRLNVTRIVFILMVTVFFLQFVPENYAARMGTLSFLVPGSGTDPTTEVSYRGRISEVLVGLQMFLDNPVLGVGYNNYNINYLDYSRRLGIDPRFEYRSAHSLYVEVAAETGILGLLVYAAIIYTVLSKNLQSMRRLNMAKQGELATMIAVFSISFVGYLSAALFIHDAYPRYFWLLVGIAYSIPNIVENFITDSNLKNGLNSHRVS